jgi:3-hydroxyisobutyrate dehydrogenase-like beta-hydroxyacid dehydrogenase
MKRTHIAWIGLGKMGLPIALRLVASGYDVAGFDLDQARVEAARAAGIKVAENADATVTGREIVCTSLPDDNALRAAMVGETGLLRACSPGAAWVETSTISVELSSLLAEMSTAVRIDYLRVPLSGNARIAHTGELTCFVSGPRHTFEKVEPMLRSFTRSQTYLGTDEQARFAKLAVNLMIAVSAGMMAESLVLASKGGLSWPDALRVLDESAVASPMVRYSTAALAVPSADVSFSCRQMAKDLDLILSASRGVGVPLNLGSEIGKTYQKLIAQGRGDQDFMATVGHVRRLAGTGEATS